MRAKLPRPVVVTLLGAATMVAALGAPTAAATAVTGTFAPQHATTHSITRAVGGNFNQDGGNWSGYVATGSGFSSISGSWNEPAVTCNSRNDLYAPWLGIDGYGSSTVEQTGVATDCSSGSPVYQAWYEMYPDSPVYYSNAVSGGDHFTASITRSGSSYTLKISDTTKGWSKTTLKSLSARNISAEAILESPTAAYPNFHSVSFTSVTVNGQLLSAYNPVALDASNSGGFEDHTGPLSGGNFTVTYLRE